jgi:hypothetical protein
MNKWLAGIAAAILLLVVCFWLGKVRTGTNNSGATGPAAVRQAAAVEQALAAASPEAVKSIASNFAAAVPSQTIFYSVPAKPGVAPAGKPHPLEFTNLEPAVVLESLRHAIRDYGSMFGGNPVGLNSEITSQLNGHNSRQANFIEPAAGMRMNAQGELVDPWGTPYFFHQLSGTRMEIRSAGPDKILWTADDLVVE